jgi:hypothetical protein
MLSDAESRRLEAHLTQCPACRDELAELRATVQSLSELPLAEAPRSFALTAAPQRIEAPKPSRRLELGLGLATVAAALVLALVAFGDLLGAPDGDDEAASPNVAEIRTVPAETGVFQGLTTPEGPTSNLQGGTEDDRGPAAAPTVPPAAMGPGEEATAVPPPPTVTTPEMAVPGVAQTATAVATATAAAAPPLEATPTPAPAAPTAAAPPAPAVTPSGAEGTPPQAQTAPAETPAPTEEPFLAAPVFAGTPEAASPTPPEEAIATPTPAKVVLVPGEPEDNVTVEAYDQALAESQHQSQAAPEDGGPSRETVVRWLEIGLATGMALLFVSWVLARRWGRA